MVQSRSASEPSSSSSSELPSLEELFREQSIVSTGRQSSNGDGDDSQRGTSESNMSSSNGSNNNEDVVVDDSPIPNLNSIFAAIFVPIPESNQLLAPLGLAPKSPEYHRAALNLVTRHEDSVRDNLQALFQRELLRISLDAEAINPSFDYHAARADVQAEDEDALRRDCDAMIATMRQLDFPNRKYSLTNVPVPNMSSIPITYMPVNSPRELAAKEVMKVVAAAVNDMTCFDRHVRSVRGAIKQQIHESESGRMDID